MGGADVIRQALEAGPVDELTIIVAPVVLGGGKRLFEGFSKSLGPRAHGRAAVAVRHIHRLPREAE
jgi:dihydrofolate reductase